MRLLVTGASGFIGSHVARAALAAENHVGILALPEDPLTRLRDVLDRLTVFRSSLADVSEQRSALTEWRPEACIHLAWYAEPGKYLHSRENLAALAGSLTLLAELAHAGCRQVVGAGSCAEYDADLGFLREDGPVRPDTLYAAAKLSFLLLGRHLARAAGMRFAWGRIFHPYGPGDDDRRLVLLALRALHEGRPLAVTQGEQVRDYIFVEDVASAFCRLTEAHAEGVFNVASGVPVTVRQLLELLGTLTGRPELIEWGALPYRDWEPRFMCADIQRLKSLGWHARHSLSCGLQLTYRWWVEQCTAPEGK